MTATVRTWQEDESPDRSDCGVAEERWGLAAQPIGIEETVRYFAVDGLQVALPSALIAANPVVRGCRMRKTAAEIALMQLPIDVTTPPIAGPGHGLRRDDARHRRVDERGNAQTGWVARIRAGSWRGGGLSPWQPPTPGVSARARWC